MAQILKTWHYWLACFDENLDIEQEFWVGAQQSFFPFFVMCVRVQLSCHHWRITRNLFAHTWMAFVRSFVCSFVGRSLQPLKIVTLRTTVIRRVYFWDWLIPYGPKCLHIIAADHGENVKKWNTILVALFQWHHYVWKSLVFWNSWACFKFPIIFCVFTNFWHFPSCAMWRDRGTWTNKRNIMRVLFHYNGSNPPPVWTCSSCSPSSFTM